ncbi:hypothetical protein GON01_02510 [Sphingomonas sp. MAH-20]|uniref:Uncharacterized protein n=1 Tax=Sphingomonas horti TaxID=2682842 RepID=A0A6I4IY01_9SPHN|nr:MULTISPECIES: hypothetical protein [Sphingomonas]MBA2920561.1 hypothetical protein [Sphingomonas sp. CGMCC 1.13658]MVO76813.1 hypothetical protein [Sphingomonas horti]
MAYGTAARDYLARARAALQTGTPQALFYAAYELRCCIEARQAEYTEALLAYEGTKIRPWKLGETNQRIKSKSYNATIARMRFKFPDGTTFTTYHTPVPDQLVEFAERSLNHLLHCQPLFREDEDPWWQKTRDQLLRGYRMCWLACEGDSLVPPLWDARTKKVHPGRIEVREHNGPLIDAIQRYVGERFRVEVSYPDQPPPEWVCDL